jgi:hypothetical protein
MAPNPLSAFNPLPAISRRMTDFDIGGRLGRQWRALPRVARLGAVIVLIGFCGILPELKLPVLNTPGSDFASVLFFPVGVYVLTSG